MTSEMTDMEEEDFADNIIGEFVYEAPMPEKGRNFLPWHRPRKQYVRHYQWCEEIGRMIAETPPPDRILKYLGLPGVDLLDLRYFHKEVCEVHDIDLRFLGFNRGARPNSKQHAELNISLDEVRKLPRVDPLSNVLGDDLALVANDRSIACVTARDLGPYDVINLDLCDGFGAQAPGMVTNSNYDAVQSLFSLQARSKNPWLLLLTTRADRANVDPDVLERLIAKYVDNLKACEPFKAASQEKFAIGTEEESMAASATDGGLLDVFLTGLCKWFVGLALALQPPLDVEVRNVMGYRVTNGSTHEDLISIALKFTPTFAPVNDPLGLGAADARRPDECTLATRALKRVAKRIDADGRLADDVNLFQAMLDASAALLELARYDPVAYRAWAQQNS